MKPGVVICLPVFNDWQALLLLLKQLDNAVAQIADQVTVVVIDDASTDSRPTALDFEPLHIVGITVLCLRRNVGHQRAIALGLTYIYHEHPCKYVVVMDADGEDAPADVIILLEHCQLAAGTTTVFAKRAKRTEGIVFLLGYKSFCILHRMLTGLPVEIGNFSVLPFPFLEQLVGVSELWNHYAAAVTSARIPVHKMPIDRSKRLCGSSKMNLTSLILHGLSAISVFGDRVAVRLLVTLGSLIVITLASIITAIGIRLLTDLAIPGWATYVCGILVVFLANLFVLMIAVVLLILHSRDKASFVPLRDWQPFVARSDTFYAR